MAKGRGNGAARGWGFAHVSIENPGHSALSTRSSHSHNTSHENGNHDGGNFSSHSQLGHSLAQDPTANSTNADQATQVGDQASDSVQADPDQQADPAKALNPKPIHSDPSDVLTPRVQLVSDLPANNGGELNSDAIHSSHDRFVIANLTFSPALQTDRGETSDPNTIGSDLDVAVTKRIAPIFSLNLDRTEFLEVSQQTEADPGTIAQYADDTPATFLPDIEKYRVKKFASIGLDDDGEAHAAWELAPFYAVAVLLVFLLLVALKTL